MASMLRFLADEPICSQAENIQDPKTLSIIILNDLAISAAPSLYLIQHRRRINR
jgi:hypothetical protein